MCERGRRGAQALVADAEERLAGAEERLATRDQRGAQLDPEDLDTHAAAPADEGAVAIADLEHTHAGTRGDGYLGLVVAGELGVETAELRVAPVLPVQIRIDVATHAGIAPPVLKAPNYD